MTARGRGVMPMDHNRPTIARGWELWLITSYNECIRWDIKVRAISYARTRVSLSHLILASTEVVLVGVAKIIPDQLVPAFVTLAI